MSFLCRWDRQLPGPTVVFSTQSTTTDLLSALLAQSSHLQLQREAQGFSLQTAIKAPAQAVIRCFGADLQISELDALLQLLPAQISLQLGTYQPHAELPAALELRLASALLPAQITQLRQVAAQWDSELVYLDQPVLFSQAGLLVMDMDSTAIQIECIDEIAKLAGVGPEVAAVTARAMNGELDFAQSLRQRVANLAGANQQVLQQVLDQLPLMPGLKSLVAFLQQQQWQVAIASGGFTFFTEALKQQLKLTATFANQLEIVSGKLTGQVHGDIVDAARKADVVQQMAAAYQIPTSQTVAIGDGANDLPMLAKAGLGVAFHAKPLVQAQAKVAIRQGSLLQLCYLLDAEDWRL